MRQKFDAADPAEVSKSGKDGEVDRSQGAARAISVRSFSDVLVYCQVD
jgi:L-lactate dehydrogenase (cytochrome)